VVSDTLSISVAATIGLGTIFKGSISAGDRAFFFDAMTFTDKYEEREVNRLIAATRWGIGLRVLLRVTDVKIDTSLNFGLVGAAVALGRASARYEIEGIGIGTEGMLIVLEEVSGLGDFTFETYLKLNGSVIKRLANYIKDHKSELEPQPIAVALNKPIDPILTARSVYYAMASIGDRLALRDAIARADPSVDRDTLRNTYVQIATVRDDAEQPSRDAEEAADRWLRR
jgi:hypothetical protein